MNQFPHDHDDQKLIAFLQENHPLPPPVKDGFEDQLMEKINLLPQAKPQLSRRRLFLVIPSAIAASLLLVWGAMRWLSPPPRFAQTVSDEELEAFLIDGWYGTMGETSYTDAQSHFEAEWSFVSYQ
jgi:hypothetical protein